MINKKLTTYLVVHTAIILLQFIQFKFISITSTFIPVIIYFYLSTGAILIISVYLIIRSIKKVNIKHNLVLLSLFIIIQTAYLFMTNHILSFMGMF